MNFLKKKNLIYANAGHPPFLYHSDQVHWVALSGIALGILRDSRYETKELKLKSGDIIVTYTDGITEAFNKNQDMFGEQRLYQSVARSAAGSAAEIIKQINADLTDFSHGTMPADDIAMIVMRTIDS